MKTAAPVLPSPAPPRSPGQMPDMPITSGISDEELRMVESMTDKQMACDFYDFVLERFSGDIGASGAAASGHGLSPGDCDDTKHLLSLSSASSVMMNGGVSMSNAQNDDDDGDDDDDRAFWRHNGFGGETPKGDLGIVGDLGISTRRTAVPRTPSVAGATSQKVPAEQEVTSVSSPSTTTSTPAKKFKKRPAARSNTVETASEDRSSASPSLTASRNNPLTSSETVQQRSNTLNVKLTAPFPEHFRRHQIDLSKSFLYDGKNAPHFIGLDKQGRIALIDLVVLCANQIGELHGHTSKLQKRIGDIIPELKSCGIKWPAIEAWVAAGNFPVALYYAVSGRTIYKKSHVKKFQNSNLNITASTEMEKEEAKILGHDLFNRAIRTFVPRKYSQYLAQKFNELKLSFPDAAGLEDTIAQQMRKQKDVMLRLMHNRLKSEISVFLSSLIRFERMSQPFMSPHLQIEQLDTIKELLDYIKSKHKNPRNYAGVSANTLNLLWKEVSQYDLTMDAEEESNLLLQIEYVQSLISSQVSERGSDDQLHSTLKTIEDKAVLDGDKPTELYAGLQNLLHKIRVLPLTAAPSSSPPSEHTKCSSQEQKCKLLLSLRAHQRKYVNAIKNANEETRSVLQGHRHYLEEQIIGLSRRLDEASRTPQKTPTNGSGKGGKLFHRSKASSESSSTKLKRGSSAVLGDLKSERGRKLKRKKI